MVIYFNYLYGFSLLSNRKGENSMANKRYTITANYNGESIKPGQVLVPVEYNELFVKTNCSNKDSIKIVYMGGRYFKVMYMAVDPEWQKTAKSQFNFIQHEQLGHYAIPNSVSLDALEKNMN